MKDAKKIAKVVAKELRKLDRQGELVRDGKKVAQAINNLREERRLTPRERHVFRLWGALTQSDAACSLAA